MLTAVSSATTVLRATIPQTTTLSTLTCQRTIDVVVRLPTSVVCRPLTKTTWFSLSLYMTQSLRLGDSNVLSHTYNKDCIQKESTKRETTGHRKIFTI